MRPEAILEQLAKHNAVLTNQHFVYTSEMHGPAYVNIRAASHNAWFMDELGFDLAKCLAPYDVDIVVGPESLGRSLASHTAAHTLQSGIGIWCDIKEEKNEEGIVLRKWAEFSPKFDFGRLITPGMRVAIVDDLLTTGGSIRLTGDLITSLGGEVVVAAVVARREPDIGAEECGVPALEVLVEVEGFVTYTEDECREVGPCSRQVPMVLRPGHGYKWIERRPDYPVAG